MSPLKQSLPPQGGQSGKLLTTDGQVASWTSPAGAPAAELPDQTGHAGEFLSTDGSAPAWDALPAPPADELPSQTGHANKFLTTDGSTPSWGAIPDPGGARILSVQADSPGTTQTGSTLFTLFSYVLPANTLAVGDKLRILGMVDFPGLATAHTKRILLTIGGLTIRDYTSPSEAAARYMQVESQVIPFTTITSGAPTVITPVTVLSVTGVTTTTLWTYSAPALDLSVDNTILFQAQVSFASASLVGRVLTVEIVKA